MEDNDAVPVASPVLCLLPPVKDLLPSPKLTHKRAFSDDVSQVSPVLEPKAAQSPKPKNDPVSRSSLCINGSHVYGDEPAPRSPAGLPPGSAPLPVPGGPRRPDEAFGFTPLHPDPHEVPWGLGSLERAQQRDEPRFIPSPPSLALQEELKVSTKAVTLSNHLGRARMEESSRLESKPTQAAAPLGFSAEPAKDRPPEDTRKEDKKAKGGFFHHGGTRSDAGGKGQGDRGTPVHTSAAGDERSKSSSWFGSKEPKESPQKPRSVEGGVEVQAGDSCPKFLSPAAPLVRAPGCSWALVLRQGRSRENASLLLNVSKGRGFSWILPWLLPETTSAGCGMCFPLGEGRDPLRGEVSLCRGGAQCGHTKWFCGLKMQIHYPLMS